MGDFTVNFTPEIHAEIKGGDKQGLPYTPIIIDPISKSYSTYGKLIYYSLSLRNIYGLLNPRILTNGKNSRFTAGGKGECQVELFIRDDKGNTDTAIITVKIL